MKPSTCHSSNLPQTTWQLDASLNRFQTSSLTRARFEKQHLRWHCSNDCLADTSIIDKASQVVVENLNVRNEGAG
jgi:hypothetical protein